jgi:integrase
MKRQPVTAAVTAEQKARYQELTPAHRRFREQTGTIVERKGAFWLRFYRDGANGARVKVTEKLCDVNTEFPTIDCKAVDILRSVRIAVVNKETHTALKTQAPLPEQPPLTVGEFALATYLPWVKENRTFSTHRHYQNTWKCYVRAELESKPMGDYRTVDGSKFLTGLASRLNRNTLSHVRALMSGIFSHATSLGLIDRNPIRDVKVLAKVRAPKLRVAYTPKETVDIINAIPRTDAKLVFALCAVMGMRPEEAAAVKWENVDFKIGVLKVREAAPYGVLGQLKTEKSKRDLTLIEPVASLLAAWHETMGKPSTGLLFEGYDHTPIDSNGFNKYHIKPHAKKACERYCGLYSGRHGAATTLYNLTGDMRAAYQQLGNSYEVVSKHYTQPDVEQGRIGSLKYEETLKNAYEPDSGTGR